ncbi:hypothetical protein CAPTEDRAFT_222949 [Capitella teleta]|uniref:FAM69 protein-kinase domain-containing protein n=1 Tax=Capitella teleta TaxID=283909 RepID=X2ATS9_CAPTE|nr:hypothetical protein CAPTEDRAFT_222949 [Capitella teleta]|eukprot:ELU04677.1 hypothetical protein CAPTEDRAFT_222949 [Capitella teleta]
MAGILTNEDGNDDTGDDKDGIVDSLLDGTLRIAQFNHFDLCVGDSVNAQLSEVDVCKVGKAPLPAFSNQYFLLSYVDYLSLPEFCSECAILSFMTMAHQILRSCFGRKKYLLLISILLLFFLVKLLPRSQSPGEKTSDLFPFDYANPPYEKSLTFRSVPLSWLSSHKCPACFGVSMCKAFNTGAVVMETGNPTFTNIYTAKWSRVQVMIHKIPDVELDNYDRMLCERIHGTWPCNVTAAILSDSSLALKDVTFLPQKLWDIDNILTPKVSKIAPLSFSICANKDLIVRLGQLFDSNSDSLLSLDETAMLFTSLSLNPKGLVLRLLHSEPHAGLLGPRFHGSCGRLMVIQHAGQPLLSLMDAQWPKRADLALQLFSFVETLMHAGFWLNDFRIDYFSISERGEVSMLYPERMIYLPKRSPQSDDSAKLCNEECFHNRAFALRDLSIGVTQHLDRCAEFGKYSGPFMFSLVCKHLLSDHTIRGLLHSAPASEAETLQDFLSECIHETSPGGRMAAVDEIVSLLTPFTMDMEY